MIQFIKVAYKLL